MDMFKTRKEEEQMGQHTVLRLGEGASLCERIQRS